MTERREQAVWVVHFWNLKKSPPKARRKENAVSVSNIATKANKQKQQLVCGFNKWTTMYTLNTH